MDRILELLKTYRKCILTHAYVNKQAGYTRVTDSGVLVDSDASMLFAIGQFPIRLDVNRIAEIRFRAGEMPEIYYESDLSEKWLANASSFVETVAND